MYIICWCTSASSLISEINYIKLLSIIECKAEERQTELYLLRHPYFYAFTQYTYILRNVGVYVFGVNTGHIEECMANNWHLPVEVV